MTIPRVLVVSGSTHAGGLCARLSALAVKELVLADIEPVRISLDDYPLPLFDDEPFGTDSSGPAGMPPNARALAGAVEAADGVLLVAPTINAGPAPMLVNALAWMRRAGQSDAPGKPPAGVVLRHRVFALAGVGETVGDALCGLIGLRQILEIGAGALVLPDQLVLAATSGALGARDEIADVETARRFRALVVRLADEAGRLR